MTGKEKAIIAIILIILVVLSLVLPDSDNDLTEEEQEMAAKGYRIKKVVVPVAAGATVALALGYCLYTRIEVWRIERDEEKKNKK